MGTRYRLGELAKVVNGSVIGNDTLYITGTSSLQNLAPHTISFSTKAAYQQVIPKVSDAAIIVTQQNYTDCGLPSLICNNPYLAFAQISQLFKQRPITQGIHPTAVISESAQLGSEVHIGAYCVIEDNCIIKDRSYIGAHCTIMHSTVLDSDCFLPAHVTLYPNTVVGKHTTIHCGTVIGADGFGYAETPDKKWQKIEQQGHVRIGEGVEIGANVTIDRATCDQTVIEDGVIIDNQVQIAHNVHIGAHTAIAGCVGIAGSTKIGKRCKIGGMTAINGHIEICDDVTILGRAMVTNSIRKSGIYAGSPVQEHKIWLKNMAVYKNLYKLFKDRGKSKKEV